MNEDEIFWAMNIGDMSAREAALYAGVSEAEIQKRFDQWVGEPGDSEGFAFPDPAEERQEKKGWLSKLFGGG